MITYLYGQEPLIKTPAPESTNRKTATGYDVRNETSRHFRILPKDVHTLEAFV